MFDRLIVTYNEPGRARKQCKNNCCGKYVHAKSKACVCGFEFQLGGLKFYEDKEKVADVVATKDEAGKGRKKCDSCGTYVGVRTKVCACGFDFANHKKPEKEKISTITDEDRNFAIAYGYPSPRSYIYCPAGAHTAPKSFDDVGFDNWVEKYIIDDGRVMTPSGYRYILRQNFRDNVLSEVLSKFNNWLKGKVNEVQQ